MNNKQSKYMDMMSMFGYVIGFSLIIYYFVFNSWPWLPAIGVVLIFVFRAIGYYMDRAEENSRKTKRRK